MRLVLTSAKKYYLDAIATSLGYCKTYVSLKMLIHISANTEKLVKTGLVLAEIFGGICCFLSFHPK